MGDYRFRSGSGRLCLDFVRTLRNRGAGDNEIEELPDMAALTAWVRQFGPTEDGSGTHRSMSERRNANAQRNEREQANERGDANELVDGVARELREAVHRLISVGMADGDLSTARREREVVNRAAAFPPPSPRLDDTGRLVWQADRPAQAVLSLIARDALDLVTSPLIHRVHECANPDCAALFLDASRPGTRRWCSMNTCGNQAKKQTLRSRTAGR
jgi:predicted RNA-binding Zn ribbon-like protein